MSLLTEVWYQAYQLDPDGSIALGNPFNQGLLKIERTHKCWQYLREVTQNLEVEKMDPLVIGIFGSSGSGKSTISQAIVDLYGEENVLVLTPDHYYGPQTNGLPYDNYDVPQAIDWDLFNFHLEELRKGNTIRRPTYDFTKSQRLEEQYEEVKAKPIIVVEGVLVAEMCASACDYMIGVDIEIEKALQHRIDRDTRPVAEGGRGRTRESVVKQFNETVLPAYEEYILPYLDRIKYKDNPFKKIDEQNIFLFENTDGLDKIRNIFQWLPDTWQRTFKEKCEKKPIDP